MAKIIFCKKLQKEAPALERVPYPGELGQKILHEISATAWDMWLAQQTMLINEHRLSMVDVKAREFLRIEMENFLFGEGSEKPAGYTPIE